MRRLEPKEEAERKEGRNKKILVAFLALIMLAGTLGIAFQNQTADGTISEQEAEYNGYEFVNRNGFWIYESYVFRYLPQQIPDIEAEISTAASYEGQPAYIYSEDPDAEVEVLANLGQIALRVQKACPEESNCTASIPEKTCNDNFIIIKEDNSTAITQEEKCVYIKGPRQDLVALTDEFLFKILGIK